MKKRILKTSALVLAVALIAGILLFANSLIGNPLSKALAKNTAEKYIEETYGDKDLVLDRVSYSFKDGWYHAYVSSPSSVDTHFILLINGFGKLKDDYYDNNVTNGWNTADRLGADYRKAVDSIFDSSSFPLRENIGYGELVFVSSEYKDDIETPDYALITNELKLDAFYNVNELGAMSGRLSVYIDDDNVTAERMAEILLEVRECFDNAGVGFYVIDCVLEHPKDENGYFEDGRIEVMDFRYSDIYEEGLVQRVESANKAAEEYYNILDGEK
jgi:hypothetical protein